ncbi:Fic family protein [Trinickia sp.]|uniref:Fic family protein n=1 Tax=Trinickia sp. TaxID=2571163 RepID=UPI003F7E3215
MDVSTQSLLQAVDADKARLDGARPLPLHTLESLREQLTLDWTYHSNAIEGNTLTVLETKVALEGVTVDGKTLREQREAANHRDAILYVEEIVAGNEALSEPQIQNIHRLVLKGIDDQAAGRYRQENATIAGGSTTSPDFSQVPAEMAGLIAWYEQAATMHPVARAAELHARFLKIRPFADGNGSTARLLLNFDLMKAGYPPAVIRQEDRQGYQAALVEADVRGDYSAIVKCVAEATHRTLLSYLRLLGASD